MSRWYPGDCAVELKQAQELHACFQTSRSVVFIAFACGVAWCGWSDRLRTLGCDCEAGKRELGPTARRDFSAGDMTAYLLLIQQACVQRRNDCNAISLAKPWPSPPLLLLQSSFFFCKLLGNR